MTIDKIKCSCGKRAKFYSSLLRRPTCGVCWSSALLKNEVPKVTSDDQNQSSLKEASPVKKLATQAGSNE